MDPFAIKVEGKETTPPKTHKKKTFKETAELSPDATFKNEPIQPIKIEQSSKSKEYGRWGLYAVKTEFVLHDIRQSIY